MFCARHKIWFCTHSSARQLKNVWTNISAQRLAGIQSNKITPNILQFIMFFNIASESYLRGSQTKDIRYQLRPDVGTSSANWQSREKTSSRQWWRVNLFWDGFFLFGWSYCTQRESISAEAILRWELAAPASPWVLGTVASPRYHEP